MVQKLLNLAALQPSNGHLESSDIEEASHSCTSWELDESTSYVSLERWEWTSVKGYWWLVTL